ncbi:LOW QUALITY PROTEIN: ABC transporter ATP-binding protein [Phytophthora palmivora]|uniref:ABC transporter ATP-binding protein n=1 Tax=Phytophthora palmivora TaxID=4796 RepID=A0A2P4Y9B3_9STRA|nr:LOW QUALITY PROTEIN: ABC transporter ATP-binding protein [Phytophthora palmivora]
MPLAREVFVRKPFKLFCQMCELSNKKSGIDVKAIYYMYIELKVANLKAGESITILEKNPNITKVKEAKYLKFPARSMTLPINADGLMLVSGTLAPGTAATDSTETITTTAEETSPMLQVEKAVEVGSMVVIKALGAVAMMNADDAVEKTSALTSLAQALHEDDGSRKTPTDAALAKATLEPNTTDICQASLMLVVTMLVGRDGADVARAAKTALDKGLIWHIKGILGKMRAQDGTPLYLVDWEPTLEPLKHLKRD